MKKVVVVVGLLFLVFVLVGLVGALVSVLLPEEQGPQPVPSQFIQTTPTGGAMVDTVTAPSPEKATIVYVEKSDEKNKGGVRIDFHGYDIGRDDNPRI